MGNIRLKKNGNLFTKLTRMLKREEWFTLSKNPEYSVCVKHPPTLLGFFVLSEENFYTISIYQNEKLLEKKDKIPEHSINYTLKLMENRLVR